MKMSFRNRLAFPTGALARFDSTHIASTNIRYSGVPRGTTLLGLLNNARALPTGAVTGINSVAGPALNYPVTGTVFNTITNPGFTDTLPAATTVAAIIMVPATISNPFIFTNAVNFATSAINFELSSQNLTLSANNTGVPSGIILTLGQPYFVAASLQSHIKVNFIAVNLATGTVQSVTITSTVAAGTNSSATNWGTGLNIATHGGIVLSAVMYSIGYLSPPELLAWGTDPWAFWYPTTNDNSLGIPHVDHIGSHAITGAAATTAAGLLASNILVAASGASTTTVAGMVSVSTGSSVTVNLNAAEAAATTAAGTLSPSSTVSPTGAAATTAAGTVAKTVTLNIAGASIVTAAGAVSFSIPVNTAIAGSGVAVSAGQVSIVQQAYVPGIPSGQTLGLRRNRPSRNR